MSKILIKPKSDITKNSINKYDIYYLSENPFPVIPMINRDSEEKKINGSIYERGIREIERSKIVKYFFEIPQSDAQHLRLGFLQETSYIGRGNGKSTFLINLNREVNENFCLNFSSNQNKCFGIYFTPEASGNSKTFKKFIDQLFSNIVESKIIDYSLATLRLEAIISLTKNDEIINEFLNEEELVEKLNDSNWLSEEIKTNYKIKKSDLANQIIKNNFISILPNEFPIYLDKSIVKDFINSDNFIQYFNSIKNEYEKYQFIFTDLVNFFLAAGFNGSYIFVDDFEKVTNFQSASQRKEFVMQLRSILYDGNFLNAKIGFYNFIFALHAGVPLLLQEAWEVSGLEHRVSLSPNYPDPKHIIIFNKIQENQVELLILKYLNEYRIGTPSAIIENPLFPFTKEAISEIAVKNEFNASKILKFAYQILEFYSELNEKEINKLLVENFNNIIIKSNENKSLDGISAINPINLIEKSNNNE